jgi:NodT family efflux transporter outer membrane factor (OMF) lipoprotein
VNQGACAKAPKALLNETETFPRVGTCAMKKSQFLLSASLLAGACSAPQAHLEPIPVLSATEWSAPAPQSGDPVSAADFWAAMGSPQLRSLVQKAIAANPDIAAAGARIEQARARAASARALLQPTLGFSAGGSASLRKLGVRPDTASSAGLSASYVVDLFGRGKALTSAARERVRQSELERRAVALDVAVEVARDYLQYAALSDRVAIAQRNRDTALELQRIIDIQVREGVASRLEQSQQRTEVANQEAAIEALVQARKLTLDALAALTGEEAPRFALAPASLSEFSLPTLRPDQPAQLVTRRPDVGAAEAAIAAASGDVTAARRAFLPSIVISSDAVGAASLLDPLHALLSVGSSLLAPIFSGGELKAKLRLSAAEQAESVELYRKALLGALQETEDALSSVSTSERREAALRTAQAEAQTAADLAKTRYSLGYSDFQTVLDSRRSMLAAEDAHARAVADRLDASIALYRAMGGAPADTGR